MTAEQHITEAERLLVAASASNILAQQAQVLATRAVAHAQIATALLTARCLPGGAARERAQRSHVGGHG